MDLLKRILLSLVFISFLPSVLIADVLDNELPGDTPVQVKEKARQVIRLGVESAGLVKMTQTMLRNRFSEQQMIKAYEILGEMKKSDLSPEPIMNKLYEGIGKHVQNRNIIIAMEKVSARYQTASQFARRISSDREQSSILTGQIAECMAAGMSDDDIAGLDDMLGRLKAQYGNGFSPFAIQTLKTVKTMARMGAGSASVLGAVRMALGNGYDQKKMSRLEKAFIIQVRTRANPTYVAESFSRGIRAGVSVDELGRQGYLNSGNGMGSNSSGNNFGSMNRQSGQGSSGSGGIGGSGSAGHGAGGSGGGGGRGR